MSVRLAILCGAASGFTVLGFGFSWRLQPRFGAAHDAHVPDSADLVLGARTATATSLRRSGT